MHLDGLRRFFRLASGGAALALSCAAQGMAQQPAPAPRPTFPAGSVAGALPLVKTAPIPIQVFAVKVYVSDIDRSIRFYRDLFDMDVLGKSGTREVILSFRNAPLQAGQPSGAAPQPYLVLIIGPNSPPVSIRNPTMMIRAYDMDAMKKKALSAGVTLEMVKDDQGRDITGFGRDPDGNWFQVYRLQ